ncbi:MAG: penicillin-binding transpeptidase domain-containing protein [Blautia marasmi]
MVVLDPKTGAVLASVSKPDFNPNTVAQDWDYLVSDSSNSSLLNRATQGAYPPGSTFKIVTALAYLKAHGSIDGFSYNCSGSITMDDHTITCYDGEVHGRRISPQPLPNPATVRSQASVWTWADQN